jgi:biopolymer transport protein TolQ
LNEHKQAVLSFEKVSYFFNPFFNVYLNIKQKTLEHLNKNKKLRNEESHSLSFEDLESITLTADTTIQEQIQKLEKYLFLLPTIVTLAPFMGLLGTVWGILVSFAELQSSASLRETVLGGLATALSTTVAGLVIAIPAVIANNMLKNHIQEIHVKLQSTSLKIRDLIELQYKNIS